MSEADKSCEDAVPADAAGPVGGLDVRIAQELIEKARADGVSLVGEGGLLQQVTRTVLQSALEAEMADHLGYERGRHRRRGWVTSATAAHRTRCVP